MNRSRRLALAQIRDDFCQHLDYAFFRDTILACFGDGGQDGRCEVSGLAPSSPEDAATHQIKTSYKCVDNYLSSILSLTVISQLMLGVLM